MNPSPQESLVRSFSPIPSDWVIPNVIKLESLWMDLPPGYKRIDAERNEELDSEPFNVAEGAYDDSNGKLCVADWWNEEVSYVQTKFQRFFSKYGEFGSYERSYKKLPSDWWIDSDFASESRVLLVDILNPSMTRVEILKDAQAELTTLKNDWMLLLTHNNEFDDVGDQVDQPGEFWFWVRKDSVEFYSELDSDLACFYASLKW